MFVSCECCVLSDRCRFVGLITRPQESYRVSRGLDNKEALAHKGSLCQKMYNFYLCSDVYNLQQKYTTTTTTTTTTNDNNNNNNTNNL
jgi:hypothetical protein